MGRAEADDDHALPDLTQLPRLANMPLPRTTARITATARERERTRVRVRTRSTRSRTSQHGAPQAEHQRPVPHRLQTAGHDPGLALVLAPALALIPDTTVEITMKNETTMKND